MADMQAIMLAYMTSNLLLHICSLKVLVSHVKVSPHLLQSLRGNDVNPQLILSLGKTQPELAPERVPRSLTEELGHLNTAVAACQGCLVDIVRALLRRLGLELLDPHLQLLNLGLDILSFFGHPEKR